jgi:MoaA/NifB/PqqE/SkfB family radical SAM enzyme
VYVPSIGRDKEIVVTTVAERPQTTDLPPQNVSFVWLEITGKCQLQCTHCYAESGPTGTHGSMTTDDWKRVIEEISDLGVNMVQFIGGEPTQHPDLVALTRHALSFGLQVEIYSNLVNVTDDLWKLFRTRGVCLATSYYSDDPEQHARITQAANSHRLTTANIANVVRQGIPLRVGIVGVDDNQRVNEAEKLLKKLGVTDIGYDGLRQVGRGIRDQNASIDQLCGNCAKSVLAISPTGDVWPCVFSRWLPVGNVRVQSLSEVLASAAIAETRRTLQTAFESRIEGKELCKPRICRPADLCKPDRQCDPDCTPHEPSPNPRGACDPVPTCEPTSICQPEDGDEPDCRPNNGYTTSSKQLLTDVSTPPEANCHPE